MRIEIKKVKSQLGAIDLVNTAKKFDINASFCKKTKWYVVQFEFENNKNELWLNFLDHYRNKIRNLANHGIYVH